MKATFGLEDADIFREPAGGGVCPHNPPIILMVALRPYSKGHVKKNRL